MEVRGGAEATHNMQEHGLLGRGSMLVDEEDDMVVIAIGQGGV